MSIENLFNHRCSIYHLQETTTSPGFGLPGQTSYSYPKTPDLEPVPYQFKGNAIGETVQDRAMNTFVITVKLSLPRREELRLDKSC